MPSRARRSAITVLAVTSLLAACSDSTGDTRADPTTTDPTTTAVGTDAGPALFDDSVVHTITVDFDEATYDELIATYRDSGEKSWMEATVTIDGTTYERAGLRLKGNSSLMGLRGGPGGGASADQPEGSAGADQPEGGAGPALGAGGVSAEAPEKLPWLIRLDEFVDGQRHQGYADIVVRSNTSSTSLNEAVALDLLDATTLPSQRSFSTSFSVNGGFAVLRLAVENPDDDAWQDRVFGTKGALYKAESTGDWSYRGDDPESYEEVFDQEGGKKVADLTPLISFLQFINESDDETFAAELGDRLDVESFATYLALMELMANFDDIDGPGNNAYLWWDAATEQMTVVPWDMNLAFGQMFGGGVGGGQFGDGPPEGFDPSQLPEGVELPEGMEPPAGFDPSQLPEGMQPPGDGAGPGDGGGPGGGGMFGRSNVLVQRFHANAEFEAIYQERLAYFRSDLFASGAADDLLDARVGPLKTSGDLVGATVVDDEAAGLREQFTSIAESE